MTDPPTMSGQAPVDHMTTTDTHDTPETELSFWQRWGELFVAIGVTILGIVVLVETQDIKMRQGVVVSPRVIPQIVGIGLVLCGLWYAVDVIRRPHLTAGGGEDSEDVDPTAPTDWPVIGTIAVGLVLYAVLMERAGFIVASAVLFLISAFAMGSRHLVRDAIISIILAVSVYVLFDGWLDVRLPAGWLEGVL